MYGLRLDGGSVVAAYVDHKWARGRRDQGLQNGWYGVGGRKGGYQDLEKSVLEFA